MIRKNRIQVLVDDALREWIECARGNETESTFVYNILRKEKDEYEKKKRTGECDCIPAVGTTA